ncbi:Alternaria alternata allergen 1 [Fusarium oxysporum f. sp. vasinfectum]|nr:Alternaria alternata allergen 1 [Fusarium oxysporum f. sp. vasinfectum]
MQFFTLLCLATSALALPQTLTKRETCMDKGSKVTEWTVKDFKYEAVYTQNTPTKQTNSATVTFTLQNRGTQRRASSLVNTDYNCDVPFEGDSASFKYNRKSGVIAIFQHWSCVKEGGWYEAKGNTTFTPKCTEKTWKNAHYKAGGDKAYSNRRVTCQQKQLKVPVLEMQAVL